MEFADYIKSELLILIPVLYLVGMALKKSALPDKLIPTILGAVSVALSALWVFATSEFYTSKDVALGIFTAIVQGILIAGASVYTNQQIKQLSAPPKGGDDDA